MKVLLVSFSFVRGGAAIAAQKFARVAQNFSNVACVTAERSVVEGIRIENPSRSREAWHMLLRVISLSCSKVLRGRIPVKHSLNLFSASNVVSAIRRAQDDGEIVHVHWINNDTLSLWAIRRLPYASVITLHDEWWLCGAEHYVWPPANVYGLEGEEGQQWRLANRVIKRIKWAALAGRDDLIITAPSKWLLERAKQSSVFRNARLRLMYNPIEVDKFVGAEDAERRVLRGEQGLGDDALVIAFGAVGEQSNPLKGAAILESALRQLAERLPSEVYARIRLLLFGATRKNGSMCGYPTFRLGRIPTVKRMRDVYVMSDLVVVPSLVEAFGQVAAEALSCSTPVVAFRTSGLVDVVPHGAGGYLAEPYDSSSLAEYIARVLTTSRAERAAFGQRGREHVLAHFSPDAVGKVYRSILKEASGEQEGQRRRKRQRQRFSLGNKIHPPLRLLFPGERASRN